jgi:hypothetical protein
MADLRVDIAAEFVGKKAFKDADNAAMRLDKTVKQLGRTLGITLGASAMAAYGKAAVKAFAEDEAAARRLSSAVDNLGLSFSKVQVASFIAGLEQSAAISDDVLRPAFQSLLNITGSLTKSQELLNNAIQISRATGIDLATVTTDLGKGYVGITRGLIKYNTGLTRAELTTRSFNDILGIMLAKSAGAAQDYLTTTSFKLDTLRVSSERAKESIGEGLVDAFAVLGGGSQASDAQKTIDNIAKGINAITMATAQAINGLSKLYKGLDFLTSFGGLTGGDGLLARTFDRAPTVSSGRSASPAGTAIRTRQQREAEAAAAKRAKEVAALTKKQVASTKALTAEQKKQNTLKKAATVFDLDQIQLIAALKGKLSEEDRKRIEAQLALLNGNDVLAQKLTREILMAQDATGGLYRYFLTIGDAKIKNPFAFLDEWIIEFQSKLNNLKFPTGNGATATVVAASTPSVTITNSGASITSAAIGTPFGQAGSFVDSMGTPFGQAGSYVDSMGTPFGQAGSTTVNVYVSGSVIAEQDLVSTISTQLQNTSLSSGKVAQLERYSGFFL